MTHRLKRVFAGKFVVVTDDDEQVFGPDTRAAAVAWVEERGGTVAASQAAATTDGSATPAQLREWDRKLSADLAKPISDEEGELRAVLLKRRDPDTAELILRQMRPILLAGKEAGRRERPHFLRPRVA